MPRGWGSDSELGPIAPDGTPVDLAAALTPGPVPGLIHRLLSENDTVLELGAGTGRFSRALSELGHHVLAVDQAPEMVRRIVGAESMVADIEFLEIERAFDCIILAAYLVNTDDSAQRREFLRTIRRHLKPTGKGLIQNITPDKASEMRVGSVSRVHDVEVTVTSVRVSGARWYATFEYRRNSRIWTHSILAQPLSHDQLASELESVGLLRTGWLGAGKEWALVACS
jgi:SAM-dependent methyltransferase